MNRTKRLCSLCFSKISSFQFYNDFYMTGLTNSQLLKVVGLFPLLFLVLFCFVAATLVFRRKRERIVRGGHG